MRLCACGCGTALSARKVKWASDACLSRVRNAAAKEARAAALRVVSKPCACGCGRIVTSGRPSRRFFSAQCGKNHWGRLAKKDREAHRATKAGRHPNTALIHEALADTPRGECIYCPERTSGPRAFTCGGAECRRSYQRDYGAMRRKREREARGRPEVQCRCGCGSRFLPERGREYLNNEHWLSARRKKGAERYRMKKGASAPRKNPAPRAFSFKFGKATEPKDIRPFRRA